MREILFKAKVKDWAKYPTEEQWVEGYYAQLGVGENVVHDICQNMALCKLFENDELNMSFTDVEIDPSTLCQFTGLTDKNDKKIFENDIVKTETYGYDKDYFITHIKFGAIFGIQGFHLANKRSLFYSGQANLEKIDDTEVIGNVFDNPELLEERN